MVEKLGSIGIAITWPPLDGAPPPPTRLDAPSQPQEPSRALQVGAFSPCLPHPNCHSCWRALRRGLSAAPAVHNLRQQGYTPCWTSCSN